MLKRLQEIFLYKESGNHRVSNALLYINIFLVVFFLYKFVIYIIYTNRSMCNFDLCTQLNHWVQIFNIRSFWEIIFFISFLLVASSLYFNFKNQTTKSYGLLLGHYFLIFLPLYYYFSFVAYQANYPDMLIFWIHTIFLLAGRWRVAYLQVFFVLFYFLSGVAKINSELWILGILDPLPFIPGFLQIFFTNFLLVLQLILPWFLLSKNAKYRLWTVIFLEIFHLYSIFLVNIFFAVVCMPLLYLLFVEEDASIEFRRIFNFLPGFLIIVFLIGIHFYRFFVGQDYYVTGYMSQHTFSMFVNQNKCTISTKIGDMATNTKEMTGAACYGEVALGIHRDKYCKGEKVSLKVENSFVYKNYTTLEVGDICSFEGKNSPNFSPQKPVLTSISPEKLNILQLFMLNYLSVVKFIYLTLAILLLLYFTKKAYEK